MNFHTAPISLVEELQLRRWARLNHVPASQRLAAWNSVIHEEMEQMDRDGIQPGNRTARHHSHLRLDVAHDSIMESHADLSNACRSEFHFA